MNFITDYQLDIDKGFMCKVNGISYQFDFKYSTQKYKYYISNILKLADFLEINRSELIGIFNSDTAYDVIYCNSKQQCYDLCQHIVKTYFRPDTFTKNGEEFTVEINGTNHTFFLTKNVLFYWNSNTIEAFHFNDHISLVEIRNICHILKINNYKHHNGKIGFETKEDAIKFAKYVITYHYPRKDKKEVCEKSREQLKHYYHGTYQVNFPNGTFIIRLFNPGGYFWSTTNPNMQSRYLYEQFELSTNQVLEICNNLKIKAYFSSNILVFDSKEDAIKFTDYLIETYIIKKEKTYDTNQLRKERTAISRGAKPAGSIIHGRRGKASIRRGCIKHQTCIGY